MTSTEEDNEALRTRVRDLETALQIGSQSIHATFMLPPRLADILGVLLSQPVVTSDMIQNKLELATEPKVAVHRLRKAMEKYGIKIQSRNRVGYWIDEAGKAEINRLIAEKMQPADQLAA